MSPLTALRSREGLLAVSAGAVLWGTNGVLVHFISDHRHLAAVSIGFYRLVFSSLVLILIAGVSSVRVWRAVTATQRWLLLLSGVLLGAYQGLYFAAIGAVGVSVSTLVSLGVAPLAITAFQSARSRRWPAGRNVVVLLLALLGLALISQSSAQGSAPHPVLGILESVGSGLGYAGSTLVSARLHPVAGPLTLTTVASVVGAFTLLPLAVIGGLGFEVDAATVGGLAYMGIIATALAYGLFFHGLRSTPSEVASVLTLLEPLTATLLAVALINEHLPVAGIVGAGLMLVAIGVLYAAPASGRTPRAAAPEVGVATDPGGEEIDRRATMDR
ncbi:MAG: transporter [Frankiales bacterium]|nr:transporter [Frankiales bacterium]